MERALADAARDGPHHLHFVRWPSGDLREMKARAMVEIARRVAEKKSLPRGLMEAALQGGKQASAAWGQAVANVPAGALALASALEAVDAGSGQAGGRVSVLAFSLGCRVLLEAITMGVIKPGRVERLVFVASAAPASYFTALAELLEQRTAVTHVYSRKDTVLDRVYPLGGGSGRPSGRAALNIDGVVNVEVDVGHRGYASIAPRLLALAVGEEGCAPLRTLPRPV